MQKFLSNIQKFESNLWGHHFSVPTEIAEGFVVGNDKRVVCTIHSLVIGIPDVEIQCALLKFKETWCILLNKKNRDKLRVGIDDEIEVELQKDTSEFGMEMPEELEVLLIQDEDGNDIFQKLTKGKQRTLIHIVGKVKNTNSRLNKALAIMQHLKESEGKLDFKRLKVLIKFHNQNR
jgi:hypothetical protein